METSYISQVSMMAQYTSNTMVDMIPLMTSWMLSKHAWRVARTFGTTHQHHEMRPTSSQNRLRHFQNHTFQKMRWQVGSVCLFVRLWTITKFLILWSYNYAKKFVEQFCKWFQQNHQCMAKSWKQKQYLRDDDDMANSQHIQYQVPFVVEIRAIQQMDQRANWVHKNQPQNKIGFWANNYRVRQDPGWLWCLVWCQVCDLHSMIWWFWWSFACFMWYNQIKTWQKWQLSNQCLTMQWRHLW
jgi:hypothetical protein